MLPLNKCHTRPQIISISKQFKCLCSERRWGYSTRGRLRFSLSSAFAGCLLLSFFSRSCSKKVSLGFFIKSTNVFSFLKWGDGELDITCHHVWCRRSFLRRVCLRSLSAGLLLNMLVLACKHQVALLVQISPYVLFCRKTIACTKTEPFLLFLADTPPEPSSFFPNKLCSQERICTSLCQLPWIQVRRIGKRRKKPAWRRRGKYQALC